MALSLLLDNAVELAKEKMFHSPLLVAISTCITLCKLEESLKVMKKNCALKWLTYMSINNVKLLTLDAYWKEVCKPQLKERNSTKNWLLFKQLRQLKKGQQRLSVDLFLLSLLS
jgi:hypothetical protein